MAGRSILLCFCRRICSGSADAAARNAPQNRPSDLIDKIIRVDHAGELGADRIYAGQMAVLGNTSAGRPIKHMWEQEKEHLKKFEELMVQKRVRPTALTPFWSVAGYALGASTALLGKEAAMACTVAVEEVISEHYDNQLRELLQEGIEEHKELLDVIQQFRDDEMDHLDMGLRHNAENAPLYSTLKQAIQLGCKVAIRIAEKV